MVHEFGGYRADFATESRGGLVDMKRVASVLGVSRATAYRLVETGALPHIRVSNAIRVHLADLERFVTARTGRAGNDAEEPNESP